MSLSAAAAFAVFGVVVDMINDDMPLDDDTIQSRLVLVVPLKLPEGEEDDDDGNALIVVTSNVAINKDNRLMVVENLLKLNLDVFRIELRLNFWLQQLKTSKGTAHVEELITCQRSSCIEQIKKHVQCSERIMLVLHPRTGSTALPDLHVMVVTNKTTFRSAEEQQTTQANACKISV